MLGMGISEMILIAGIALVIIGPEKFPEFAKICMRTIRDLRSYVEEAKDDLRKELTPIKKEIDEVKSYDPESYIDALTDSRDESDYYGTKYGQHTGESGSGSSGAQDTAPRTDEEKPATDTPASDTTAPASDATGEPATQSDPASPPQPDLDIPKPMDG